MRCRVGSSRGVSRSISSNRSTDSGSSNSSNNSNSSKGRIDESFVALPPRIIWTLYTTFPSHVFHLHLAYIISPACTHHIIASRFISSLIVRRRQEKNRSSQFDDLWTSEQSTQGGWSAMARQDRACSTPGRVVPSFLLLLFLFRETICDGREGRSVSK